MALEIDIELSLRGELADAVVAHAKRLGQEPAEMLADILEIVFEDNLVNAILDRD